MSITAAFAIANAASASAAALYVDDSGTDTGGCTAPSSPCDTIGYAISQAGTTDVIHLGGGTYDEAVTLPNAVSLIEDSAFSAAAAGQAVLDVSPPPSTPAIALDSTGTVSGLTINSTNNAVFITASGTLSNNLFAFGGTPLGLYGADVVVGGFFGASPTITGNTFVDPTPVDDHWALVLNSSGSPVVSGNSFDGFNSAIQALNNPGTTPTITGNTITGIHDAAPSGVAIQIGTGAVATLTANNIHSPGTGTPAGIRIDQNVAGLEAGATLSRNRIIGHEIGLSVFNNEAAVSLQSDLIAKSGTYGLLIQEGNVGTGVTATNATIVDTTSGTDVLVEDALLTLDSSIVGAGPLGSEGIQVDLSGSCSITFSRGTGESSPGGCDDFGGNTADPMFVNPAANNYHLLAGSPMIDAGNTTPPILGTLDIDGDPRALAVAAQCATPPAGRRDIGADEFLTTCPPPPTPPSSTPAASTPPAKKCKKGQKLKQGKCVKKKRKKRKK